MTHLAEMHYGFMPAYGNAYFVVRQLIEKYSAANMLLFADLAFYAGFHSWSMRKHASSPMSMQESLVK